MDPLRERLAKVDAEATEVAAELEDARREWVAEKDATLRAVRKTVYDEHVNRVLRVSSRIAALEAKLSGLAYGGERASKRTREEDVFPSPMSSTYGNVPIFGPPASLRGPPNNAAGLAPSKDLSTGSKPPSVQLLGD